MPPGLPREILFRLLRSLVALVFLAHTTAAIAQPVAAPAYHATSATESGLFAALVDATRTTPPAGSVGGAYSGDAATPSGSAHDDDDATASENENDESDSTSASDSTIAPEYPQKLPGHYTWEKIAAIPGYIIYVPFWIVLNAAGLVLKLNEKATLFPKLEGLLISKDGTRGILPVFDVLQGIGITYFAKDVPNLDAQFTATLRIGLRGLFFYELEYDRVDIFGGRMTTGYLARYFVFPEEGFFGIGPNTSFENESNFTHERIMGGFSIGGRVGERFELSGLVGIEHNIIKQGRNPNSPSTTDLFDESTLPGIDSEAPLATLGGTLHWNATNRPKRPSKGIELKLDGGVSQQISGDQFGFTHASADIRGYLQLFRDRIIVLRFATRLTDPLAGQEIPFYLASQLGPTRTVRGYSRGRFRDLDMALATIEYRYPVSRQLDFLLFADAGQVQQDIFRDFRRDDTKWSFGGGFHAWKESGSLLRIELAKSADRFRLHVILN